MYFTFGVTDVHDGISITNTSITALDVIGSNASYSNVGVGPLLMVATTMNNVASVSVANSSVECVAIDNPLRPPDNFKVTAVQLSAATVRSLSVFDMQSVAVRADNLRARVDVSVITVDVQGALVDVARWPVSLRDRSP